MRLRTIVCLIALLPLFSLAGSAESQLPTPPASGEPPVEAVVGDVPFLTSDEPNRIVVNLAPDGYDPFRMMIDTGASDSVLTPRYAQKLGVIVRREQDHPYRHATRLDRDLQFWVDTRSSDTASKTGWEYGLLGGTFLRDYVMEFDFAAERVRFLHPERYRVPETTTAENEAVVPIKVVGNRATVEISIGGKAIKVMIDTGDWNTAVLSGAAASTVGISSTPLPGMRGGSVWGPMEVEFAEVESLRLGPFELNHVPLVVAPNGWYNMASSTDSVIGYDILAQFTVRIDYPRQRLWLRRRSDVELTYGGESYALQRRAGVLIYSRSHGLRVIGLFPDSAAGRLGILPGDTLRSPSGMAVGQESKLLETIATGGHISVVRQVNGASVEIPLPAGSAVSSPAQPTN
jgi:predicted aspartyl protease